MSEVLDQKKMTGIQLEQKLVNSRMELSKAPLV